jgi:hypothetical protein
VSATSSPLHPALDPLAALVGTWVGEGTGRYPAIETFTYREELVFGHIGKPFLTYSQRTFSDAGAPLHSETGYLRCPGSGRVEVAIAQPTGVVEIDEGTVETDGDAIVVSVASATVGVSNSAKPVTAVRRQFRLAGDVLEVRLEMAAVGEDLTLHLTSRLLRT